MTTVLVRDPWANRASQANWAGQVNLRQWGNPASQVNLRQWGNPVG